MQGKRLNDSSGCKDRDLVDLSVDFVSDAVLQPQPELKKDKEGKKRVRIKRDAAHESERRLGGKKASRNA
jgi:hypothetical protein